MPKVGESLTKEQTAVGMERLKPQQQKFLDLYFNGDKTQTAAAREAGYKNATVAAVRLLRNPVVQERLEEMRLEARTKYGVTVDKSVRDLKKMRDEAWEMGKFGEAIRAEELRLKATGLLVNKSHVMNAYGNQMLSKSKHSGKLERRYLLSSFSFFSGGCGWCAIPMNSFSMYSLTLSLS